MLPPIFEDKNRHIHKLSLSRFLASWGIFWIEFLILLDSFLIWKDFFSSSLYILRRNAKLKIIYLREEKLTKR